MLTKVTSLILLFFCLSGCQSQKLTIFYSDTYYQHAKNIEKQVKSQTEGDWEVLVKPIDYYHDFKGETLIYGAYTDWEIIANITQENTQRYPSTIPAAIGKHFYRKGNLGLYLVTPFESQQLHSCLKGSHFYEQTGSLKKSPITLDVYQEDDSMKRLDTFYYQTTTDSGESLFQSKDNGSLSLSKRSGGYQLTHKSLTCFFEDRTPTLQKAEKQE